LPGRFGNCEVLEGECMRLIIIDRATEDRRHFWPLALSRPVWDLRCGFTSLGDKVQQKIGVTDIAYFTPTYLAEAYRERTGRRYDDHRRIDGRFLHHLGYGVINGHAMHLGAFPARGYAAYDPDVIFQQFQRMVLPLLSCCTLEDDTGIPVNQYGHLPRLLFLIISP